MLSINSITSTMRRAREKLIALWRLKIAQPPPIHTKPVFVIVEGPRDMQFLRRISTILHDDDPAIPDLATLEASGHIVFVPFGGSHVRLWTFRLASTNCREVHILDRETSPTTELREHVTRIVNLRPGCRAFLMQRRALENYLCADAIFDACGVQVAFSEQDDVSHVLAKAMYNKRHCEYPWESLPTRSRKRHQNHAKCLLNAAVVERMTPQRLSQSDPNNEIRLWITTIGQMVAGSC